MRLLWKLEIKDLCLIFFSFFLHIFFIERRILVMIYGLLWVSGVSVLLFFFGIFVEAIWNSVEGSFYFHLLFHLFEGTCYLCLFCKISIFDSYPHTFLWTCTVEMSFTDLPVVSESKIVKAWQGQIIMTFMLLLMI